MGAGHAHSASSMTGNRQRRPLVIAFALTSGFMLIELVAGLTFDSLALLSDAGHMGTDVVGLGMALAAITLVQRPATARRTFGTYRLEVLAALGNGLLLFAVAGYMASEAVQRFAEPADVPGTPLLVVAILGLIVNVVSVRLLTPGARSSLNVRGAYLEVMGDTLASIGVIVAAVIIMATGWSYADPIVAAAIGLAILPRTWSLSRQALRILMEAAPADVDVEQVRSDLQMVPGVDDVHDLHIWTLTSGLDSASAHVVVSDGAGPDVLPRVRAVLTDRHGISHVTVQCEPADHEEGRASLAVEQT